MTNKDSEEEFREWMFKKANTNESYFIREYKYDIILYMRVMFAINRERKIVSIGMAEDSSFHVYGKTNIIAIKSFRKEDHNNSELQALEKALKFVKKEMKE